MRTTVHCLATTLALVLPLAACGDGAMGATGGHADDDAAPSAADGAGADGVVAADTPSADPRADAGPGDAGPASPKANPTLLGIAENTALDLGKYRCDQPADNPGGCNAITDYGRFNYDPVAHQLLMFGGGHAGAYGNEVERFDFATLQWSATYKATLCADQTPANFDPDTASWKDNGAPLARHVWDMMTIADVAGRRSLVILTSGGLGAETCNPGPAQTFPPLQTRTMWFDIEAKKWTFGRTMPDKHWYYATAGETDPVSGKQVVFGDDGVKLYDPAADSVTDLAFDPASKFDRGHIGYSNNLVYYPPTDRFYYFARGEATLVFELVLDRARSSVTVSELTTTGAGPTDETGWAYDSKNKVIGGGIRAGVFSAFDPATRSWDRPTMKVASDGGVPDSVVFHALDYDPVDDVYVFLNTEKRTWAYRYR